MLYFAIDLMPRRVPDFCFLQDYPEDIGLAAWRFDEGEALGDDYPDDARVFMSKDEPGMQLASLIGNTRNMLIVHGAVKDVIEGHVAAEVEYLPLAIFNHKRRLASDEYFILNPIGGYDCLDHDASEIEYLDGEVVAVNEIALDPAKLEDAPHLFRVKESLSTYVASQALLDKLLLGDLEVTNFFVERLKIAGE